MELAIPVMRPVAPDWNAVKARLGQVHGSGWFSNFGPQETFVRERFADRFGVCSDRIASVSNATLGLAGSVLAAGNDSWAAPSFTFTATPASVLLAGRRLRFGDIDSGDWWLEGGRPASEIGRIPVVPFGGSVEDSSHWGTGEVVVDAAASLGNDCDLSGLSESTAVIFSLHATKVLGAGEGAIVVFGSAERAQRFRIWTNFGFFGSRDSQLVGINAKMSEMQAAYVHAALDGWEQERDEWLAARERVLRVGDDVGLTTFRASREAITPYWIAVFPNSATTDLVERVIEEHGIGTRRWWSRGCHRMPAYADVPRDPLPVTEDVAGRYLGLPMYRGLSAEDAERIHAALLEARRRAEVW